VRACDVDAGMRIYLQAPTDMIYLPELLNILCYGKITGACHYDANRQMTL